MTPTEYPKFETPLFVPTLNPFTFTGADGATTKPNDLTFFSCRCPRCLRSTSSDPELNRPIASYTIKWFIGYFEAIPEDYWCTGAFESTGGTRCAMGHLGHNGRYLTPAATALHQLFPDVMGERVFDINDGLGKNSRLGSTPKQRILAALRIKLREGMALKSI